ncbi:MAG: hypothetical protein RBR08_11980 [Desulforegulaceae bacterium]|nr:hypothetical protein [Desulforegulaceae bacterium]
MWKLIFFFSFTFIFQCFASFASVVELGNFGSTHQISEPDILSEIEERVNDPQVQENAKQALKKAVNNYSHPMKERTSWATQDSLHYIDPTYTLPYDIPNGHGGFLYRKGHKINPLHHIVFHQTIFILDPTDKRQILWLQNEFKNKELLNPLVLLSFGHMIEDAQKFPFPVYAMTQDLKEFFQIKKVPAKITQAADLMKIETFNPEKYEGEISFGKK